MEPVLLIIVAPRNRGDFMTTATVIFLSVLGFAAIWLVVELMLWVSFIRHHSVATAAKTTELRAHGGRPDSHV